MDGAGTILALLLTREGILRGMFPTESRLEVVGMIGKLAPRFDMGREFTGSLLGVRYFDVSGANTVAWLGANVACSDVEDKLWVLLAGGRKGYENSGILGGPEGPGAFNPGYCKGCCME